MNQHLSSSCEARLLLMLLLLRLSPNGEVYGKAKMHGHRGKWSKNGLYPINVAACRWTLGPLPGENPLAVTCDDLLKVGHDRR